MFVLLLLFSYNFLDSSYIKFFCFQMEPRNEPPVQSSWSSKELKKKKIWFEFIRTQYSSYGIHGCVPHSTWIICIIFLWIAMVQSHWYLLVKPSLSFSLHCIPQVQNRNRPQIGKVMCNIESVEHEGFECKSHLSEPRRSSSLFNHNGFTVDSHHFLRP